MMHCLSFPFLNLISLSETDSTNNYLRRLLMEDEALEEFTTVVADYQDSGKGQRGNSWESQRGKNLLFSFLLRPDNLAANEQFLLSQIISISIVEVLSSFSDGFSIKWPNDIYWKDKKICGILIENTIQGSSISESIIGVGININQQKFVSNAPNPVSLIEVIQRKEDIHIILDRIMWKVYAYYKELNNESSRESIKLSYHNALFRLEEKANYKDVNGIFVGKIIGVTSTGLLKVSDEAGEIRTYAFKEIGYILK